MTSGVPFSCGASDIGYTLPNKVQVNDTVYTRWPHKIVVNYEENVSLLCRKKRLAPTIMLNSVLALGGLDRGGGSACCPPTLHLPGAEAGVGEGAQPHLPTPTYTPAHANSLPVPPFLFTSLPPGLVPQLTVALTPFLPFSPAPPPFYYFSSFPSLDLSALPFSPPLPSPSPVLLPSYLLSFSRCPPLQPSSGPLTHVTHTWYFYCTFSVFRYINT